MKKLLLFLLVSTLTYTGFAQSYSQVDPAIGQPYFVDANGVTVDANTLTVGQVVRLRLAVQNNDFFASIAPQNTRLQISLGPNLQVTSPGTIASSPLNAQFAWTVTSTVTGQEIRGNQIATISPDYNGIAEFSVTVTGLTPPEGSVIVANFFVTNGNPQGDIIGDYQSANNASTLIYRTATALPVVFVSVNAVNNNCTVNASWKVAQELNVGRYELLVAGKSMATVSANGSMNYSASFSLPEQMRGQVVTIQVRAVDNDGKTTLSNIAVVSGSCNNARQLIVYAYPNPVTNGNAINVAAKEGVFNGKYRLELVDNNGKLFQVKEVNVSNVVSVPFEFNTTLSPGKYMIRVSTVDGSQVGTVQFIKVGGVL